ncbi:hypothetical protein BDW62DRAFT_191669 [Aspergillus aurantiobrunneus]
MPPYPDTESQAPSPSQSYHTRTVSRSIHIDFNGWAQKQLQITEGGPGGAVIYSADLARKFQMKFFTGTSGTSLATVVNRANSHLEVAMHGQKITIDIKTRLKKEGRYESPSLEYAPLTWNSRSMKVYDFELRDGNGIPLAQFNPHPSWTRRKTGRLDFFGPGVGSGRPMEEIMVTAFALVHSTALELEAATAGTGASS